MNVTEVKSGESAPASMQTIWAEYSFSWLNQLLKCDFLPPLLRLQRCWTFWRQRLCTAQISVPLKNPAVDITRINVRLLSRKGGGWELQSTELMGEKCLRPPSLTDRVNTHISGGVATKKSCHWKAMIRLRRWRKYIRDTSVIAKVACAGITHITGNNVMSRQQNTARLASWRRLRNTLTRHY